MKNYGTITKQLTNTYQELRTLYYLQFLLLLILILKFRIVISINYYKIFGIQLINVLY